MMWDMSEDFYELIRVARRGDVMAWYRAGAGSWLEPGGDL